MIHRLQSYCICTDNPENLLIYSALDDILLMEQYSRERMTNMIKKALAVLLTMTMLFSAAPLVFAEGDEDGWLIYYENVGENTYRMIVVAPAKYTRLSDAPRIETIHTDDPAGSVVATPAAEQIRYYWDGKTEPHWMLTVVCEIPDGSFPGYSTKLAVLPGSVLDDAGRGNPRVFFEEDVVYRETGGYAEIEIFSSLLQKDYSRSDDTVAVGDTLRVDYSGLDPVEILLNGEKVADFPGGEMQRYTFNITKTGPLDVVVRQGGKPKETRALTVITSKEMYERNLRDGLITGEDIPSTEDLVDVGLPQGSLFIPLAKIIAFFVSVRDFLQRLLSFSRVTE